MRNSRPNNRFANNRSPKYGGFASQNTANAQTNGIPPNNTFSHDTVSSDTRSDDTLSKDILSLEKRHMVEQLQKSLTGKTPNEALVILMEWQKQLRAKNIQFTPQENELLTNQLYSTLSPSQRKQFEMLKGMMNTNK